MSAERALEYGLIDEIFYKRRTATEPPPLEK
jgi:ATP-dependent protease ClpP protease subunit